MPTASREHGATLPRLFVSTAMAAGIAAATAFVQSSVCFVRGAGLEADKGATVHVRCRGADVGDRPGLVTSDRGGAEDRLHGDEPIGAAALLRRDENAVAAAKETAGKGARASGEEDVIGVGEDNNGPRLGGDQLEEFTKSAKLVHIAVQSPLIFPFPAQDIKLEAVGKRR